MDVSGPDSSSQGGVQASPAARKRFSIFNVLVVALPLVLLVASVSGWYWVEATREANRMPSLGGSFKFAVKTPEKLDERFVDADGDLVADAPKDPKDWLDPPTLVFATLGSDGQKDNEEWADFVTHLKKVTGKKEVVLVQKPFLRREQFEEIAKGEQHILALSTGAVTAAVNLGGFVPVCVMADAGGKWGYEMELIVPKDSSVATLSDIRGKKVALANFASLSGFKLPIVTLWENGLIYAQDYSPSITGGHSESIQAIRAKRADVAATASDYLKRQVAAGKIGADEYKVIYRSKTYPPACFGYVHNLKPELAEKIRQAFFDFNWTGSSLEAAYKNADQVKFVPISYKTDWEGIRETERQLLKIAAEKR